MDSEIFKPIIGYSNYLIGNNGTVKSLDRFVKTRGNCVRLMKGKILKPNERKGYSSCILYNSDGYKNMTMHRLVALHFLENPNNLPIVNHIDSNRYNNNYKNLEYCTNRYNIQHSHYFKGRKNLGVSFTKSINKYKSTISVDGVYIYLGVYDTFEDALNARKQYEADNNILPFTIH